MGEPPRIRAARLRQLSGDLADLADRIEEPSRSLSRAESLIAEGERIAVATRAVFRGSCSR